MFRVCQARRSTPFWSHAMRLVQDVVLLACLLFLFSGARNTDISHPVHQLWSTINATLEASLH